MKERTFKSEYGTQIDVSSYVSHPLGERRCVYMTLLSPNTADAIADAILSLETADAVAVALIQATPRADFVTEAALPSVLQPLDYEARVALGLALIRSAVAP